MKSNNTYIKNDKTQVYTQIGLKADVDDKGLYKLVPFDSFERRSMNEMVNRSDFYLSLMKKRRTVREFSDEAVPLSVIQNCIQTAATAPNGANRQPWHFSIVKNSSVKKKIREAAEIEEREFYGSRASKKWLEAIKPLGTDSSKPFLEKAPYLIAVFAKNYELNEKQEKQKNYYISESVGIATGFLISALHYAGLATLTHTPNPMIFLNKILDRPKNERPYMIIVTGYPSSLAKVPVLTKKPFDQVASIVR